MALIHHWSNGTVLTGVIQVGHQNWKQKLGWTEDHLDELRIAGYSYIRQGKYEIALPFFEALCIVDRENAYNFQTLGAIYLELSSPSKAIKAFDKALKIEGDHAPTLLNFTKALLMLGKKDEALNLCKVLQDDLSPDIASMAKALLLAHS